MRKVIVTIFILALATSCRSLRPPAVTAADYAFDAQLAQSRKERKSQPHASAGTRHNIVKSLTVKQ